MKYPNPVQSLALGLAPFLVVVFALANHQIAQSQPFQFVRVKVVIERVKERGCLEGSFLGVCGGNPDFYARVSIAGVERGNKPANDAWGDDDDISPDWEFEESVDRSKNKVPIWIEIWDEDGGLRGSDDKADIQPGSGKRLDLWLFLDKCTISREASGTCNSSITSRGGGDDSVRIDFRITWEPEPFAPGLGIRCIHSPIWPQPTQTIEIRANPVDENAAAVSADAIEIWIDGVGVAATGSGTSLTHIAGPYAGPFVSYRCIAKLRGEEVSSGYRMVGIGLPPQGEAIPVLYNGGRASNIDLVFIPDEDSYTGPFDGLFLSDVENVIWSGFYSETLFLNEQTSLNFWIAGSTGDADGTAEECILPFRTPGGELPISGLTVWDISYSFADVGAILHRDPFRDCAPGGERLFSSEPTSLRTILHESGHRPFGLADEYCCDGGYYQTEKLPNLYTTLSACQLEAVNMGRPTSACRTFLDEDGENWHTSDPSVNDLMVDNRDPQILDIRKVTWLLDECAKARCEPSFIRERAMAQAMIQPPPGSMRPVGEGPPNMDYDDHERAIVVRLRFESRTDVVFQAAEVSSGRTHAVIAEPPPLQVRLFDQYERLIDHFNYEHPLIVRIYGSEQVAFLQRADGRFVLPFRRDLATMQLFDTQLSRELIEVALGPIVEQFCAENPSDANCTIALPPPPNPTIIRIGGTEVVIPSEIALVTSILEADGAPIQTVSLWLLLALFLILLVSLILSLIRRKQHP